MTTVRKKEGYAPEVTILVCLNATGAEYDIAGVFGPSSFTRGLSPERRRLCETSPPIECVWYPRRSSQLGLHLLPSTSPGVPLPPSPGEAPQRSPQKRQMSSSSEKNSSSSSSAEAKLVKSTLYLNRPPIPPNPLTNSAPSCERFFTNSTFAPNS